MRLFVVVAAVVPDPPVATKDEDGALRQCPNGDGIREGLEPLVAILVLAKVERLTLRQCPTALKHSDNYNATGLASSH